MKTLLDIDVRKVLEGVGAKCGLRLPRMVVTVDYGVDVGDLFVRFEFIEDGEGEPTGDGRVIVHCDRRGSVVAVEITDITIL